MRRKKVPSICKGWCHKLFFDYWTVWNLRYNSHHRSRQFYQFEQQLKLDQFVVSSVILRKKNINTIVDLSTKLKSRLKTMQKRYTFWSSIIVVNKFQSPNKVSRFFKKYKVERKTFHLKTSCQSGIGLWKCFGFPDAAYCKKSSWERIFPYLKKFSTVPKTTHFWCRFLEL